jgi:flagellar motor protein MotB
VDPVRMAISGKGETQPVASNNSEAGRQQNRRVEIYVEPVRAS